MAWHGHSVLAWRRAARRVPSCGRAYAPFRRRPITSKKRSPGPTSAAKSRAAVLQASKISNTSGASADPETDYEELLHRTGEAKRLLRAVDETSRHWCKAAGTWPPHRRDEGVSRPASEPKPSTSRDVGRVRLQVETDDDALFCKNCGPSRADPKGNARSRTESMPTIRSVRSRHRSLACSPRWHRKPALAAPPLPPSSTAPFCRPPLPAPQREPAPKRLGSAAPWPSRHNTAEPTQGDSDDCPRSSPRRGRRAERRSVARTLRRRQGPARERVVEVAIPRQASHVDVTMGILRNTVPRASHQQDDPPNRRPGYLHFDGLDAGAGVEKRTAHRPLGRRAARDRTTQRFPFSSIYRMASGPVHVLPGDVASKKP